MSQNTILRNNVHISGKGEKTIIFAPGFGCDQTVWSTVAPAFEEEYNVVLFDYVGMGKSNLSAFDPIKYGQLSGYAQDILDVCAALDLKDALFIGHSVSGMIGLLASIQQADLFSKLIMVAPSPCYLNDPPEYYGGFEHEDLVGLLDMMEKNYIGWANAFSTTLLNNPARGDVAQNLEERFCSTDPLVAQTFAKACFFADHRQDLVKACVPSLIMQCSNDIIAPRTVSDYMKLNLPNSTIAYLNAVGHCPHMSDPEETVQCIKNYIANQSAQEVGEEIGGF